MYGIPNGIFANSFLSTDCIVSSPVYSLHTIRSCNNILVVTVGHPIYRISRLSFDHLTKLSLLD